MSWSWVGESGEEMNPKDEVPGGGAGDQVKSCGEGEGDDDVPFVYTIPTAYA